MTPTKPSCESCDVCKGKGYVIVAEISDMSYRVLCKCGDVKPREEDDDN